jgi:endoglucanase
MKKCKILILILLCLVSAGVARSQTPFNRGVNLSGWFQSNSPGQIQFTRFVRHDLVNIKSLGCDVIRLPINLHGMTSGSPDYTLDRMFLSFLDSVVNWSEQLNIYLILDNHSFDPNDNTSPAIGDILIKVWTQMAQHYKGRSDYIIYEILNEPHGIAASTWGAIQGQVINAIRLVDTKHTIIVGGVNFNTYTELQNIPVYTDQNLIYTFHFYDPFMFTHQGATWVNPSMGPLAGVPFPYNATEMPVCPASLKGTWIESGLNNYPTQGTVNYVKSLIDIAVNFKNTRNVKIYCGELGVYIPNSDPADRVFWYNIVRQYLEEKEISWTTWDYQGGFGLFNGGSNELFDHDLNIPLLGALGFNIPPQTPFVINPEATGFMIYSDYLGQNIHDVSYGTGTVNFYSTLMPNNNSYCIGWKGFSQYNTVGFDFSPDKDLSVLKAGGYALDFMVRGFPAGIKFDVRFVDNKTGVSDHPWRMGYTIDQTIAAWDRRWHHLHINLNAFNERGSWDNGSWYNPEGKFDWTRVDKLEITTEYSVSAGQELWFDNIYITNLDTALVRETGVGINDLYKTGKMNLNVRPNPFSAVAFIGYDLSEKTNVSLNIFSISGTKIRQLINEYQPAGTFAMTWDGRSENGIEVPNGLYICLLKTTKRSEACKIIKTRQS